MHEELASAEEYVPSEHKEQLDAARFEYLPAKHTEHSVAAAPAYFPPAHAPDACERPDAEQ